LATDALLERCRSIAVSPSVGLSIPEFCREELS
jgi:hypothetical protein